jgi:putative ABC transport system substrate-binding protein
MSVTNRRRFVRQVAFVSAGLPFAAPCLHLHGQQARRIGFLIGEAPTMIAAFEDELKVLGYGDASRLVVEKRISRSNTSDTRVHAEELARMDLELVVAASLPQALAIRQVNPGMPMVIGTCPGMVSNGFAASLERPGGLYTGMEELPSGVTERRLSLLRIAAPTVVRVGLLSTTPGTGGHETQVAEAENAARALGVTVRPYRAQSRRELESTLASMAADRVDAFVNFQGALSLANQDLIVAFATQHRLPAIYQSALFPRAGGLMAWSPNQEEQFRIAARYVDTILRGAKPGDLPIRHPDRYYLTVNRSAARGIGLDLSANLLSQADFVLP